MKTTSIYLLILLFTLGFNNYAMAQEVKKISALAKKPAFVLPDQPAQWDFLFDKASDTKAWLRDNGELFIEGYIQHNHFRCGTYELGIQFGKGDGCANVEWLSDPVYVSHKRQCNQAVLHHNGYQKTPAMVEKFNQVTCGQLLIRCEGTCGIGKTPSGGSNGYMK